ncbi:MAG TPA: efflux RND transporter permease subunit [Lacunisphaera sp.]|nr:efflux RND transporter permease subunit [Lacunisphaera sp.]
MHFTDLFIRRPVLATVVSLLILLGGGICLFKLNVRQFPETKNAVVRVTTVYVGASADLIAGFVTTPLEREIAAAEGIDYLESTSSPSVSIVTARLRLNYDPNAALTQITAKVNRARRDLPADAEEPIIELTVGESTASMYLSFASPVLNANQITDYLSRVVQPKLSTVPGVQKADILGARLFAMRIWLRPDRLAAHGLSALDVRAALSAQNVLSAVGHTKGAMISINLDARTDLRTAEEFRRIIVRDRDGSVVRLGDVAEVVLGAESYDAVVRASGSTATGMSVSVLPTANPLTVIAAVRRLWPELTAQLPPEIKAGIIYDATAYIQSSIDEVMQTLIEAIVIVCIVIYLFLGSFRAVLVPVIAIPLSLIGGGLFMLALGFSINLLTLLAMVLAIGLVVDDAIVIVENIHRHIERGLSPMDAALGGARELVGPIVAMTITLAAVYAPLGLQTGLTGTLFREFAFTLAGAVVVSGVIALTLSPMMCGRVLRPTANTHGFAHFLDVAFERLRGAYERVLDHVLDNRAAVYAVAVLIVLSLVPFYLFTRKELAPDEDQNFVITAATAAPNASIDQTDRYLGQVRQILQGRPETAQSFTIAGYPATNSGVALWVLKPWDQRPQHVRAMLPQYQGQLAGIAGLNTVAFLPPSLPGSSGGLPVQFVVTSTDEPRRVADVANELLGRAMASGRFLYGDNSLKFDQPQTELVIDRDKASALGINMNQLSGDLGTLLGGGYVNRFNVSNRAYKVIPQVERVSRLNPGQLGDYYVRAGNGELVALSAVVRQRQTVEPQGLPRFQQLNAATISLLPAGGVSLGEALDFLRTEAREVFPQGYSADYAGPSRQFMQEGSSLLLTFALAVIVIFLVLAAQYESFRDPFVIMMAVPLSLAGAMVFLFLGLASLNIYTQVGLITLVGLITKHGILIVQFANELQAAGCVKREAVEHAAGVRLRPILMTTAAMVFGIVPLLFASGAGAASRFNMGLVIAAGMSIGTLFTLFVVPAFYLLVAHDRRAARRTDVAPAAAIVPAPAQSQ